MTRLRATMLLVAGALTLSACGGDEEGPRTVVVTAPPSDTAPATGTAPPAEQTQPPGQAQTLPPLPSGVIGADGTYSMTVSDADNEGVDLAQAAAELEQSNWSFTTTCQAGDCTVAMRQALEGGGFKSLMLRPAEGRPNVYVTRSGGEAECPIGPPVETRQRYSIRLSDPTDMGGRQTAQRIDAYLTESTADGCNSAPESRATVSWRGTLGAGAAP